MRNGKYYKSALMALCYGASPTTAARQSKLGLRRTKVTLKKLKGKSLKPFTDFRGRIYRGYTKVNALQFDHAQTSLNSDYYFC